MPPWLNLIFGGWFKWLWIGAAVLFIGGAWLRYEQVISQRDLARSQVQTANLEKARLTDTNAELNRTIGALKAEKALGEKLQASEAATRQTIERTLAQWKERLAHVPQTCPVGDSDRILLDGVRDILSRSAPADPRRDR
jgi:hypothetical protein